MSWNSQQEESLRFTAAELEISRQYIWDRVAKSVLLGFIGARPGDAVLDVGCGTGFLLRDIAASIGTGTLVGLDTDEGLLAEAERLSSGLPIRYIKGSAYEMPFEDDSFDVVTAEFVLCNLEHPEVAVAEFVRVVRPGGTVVAVDPPTAQRFLYSPTIPAEIQSIEHRVNAHIAAESARRGVEKAIGIRLPDIFLTAGLTNVRARGHLNVRLECQGESLDHIRARSQHALIMLRRQQRRLQAAVDAQAITQDELEKYLDFWTRRRQAVVDDPASALQDPTCHLSTALFVAGTKPATEAVRAR